ncbi:MAG: hypothetical protein JJE13_03200 [Thermoleophilia bacterium]|nr:hypothetical protein [Thermoleophilia bacterium]
MGSLLVVALIFSVWANRQALDTDSWVNTSDRVLENPEVQVELAQYISDELFDSINIGGDVRSELPAQLRDLPDTTPERLRREVSIEVLKAFNVPRFKQIWSESNRTAHEALINDLDSSGELSGRDAKVTLNLNPFVTAMSAQLGFADDITAQIPPDVARLTVVEGNRVSTARDAVRVTRALLFILGILVIVFFGAAILLAGFYRRLIVLASGFGLVAAGAMALILRGMAEQPVVDWLASDDSVRPAVDGAWSVGTSLLVTISIWTMVIGAVIMLGVGLAALWPSDRRTPDRFQHYSGP